MLQDVLVGLLPGAVLYPYLSNHLLAEYLQQSDPTAMLADKLQTAVFLMFAIHDSCV